MKQEEAVRLLEKEDKSVRHVYHKFELQELFGENDQEFEKTFSELVDREVVRHLAEDLYEYRLSAHRGVKTLNMLAQALRPNDIVYESLEFAASLYGLISQIPTVYTCMTTGEEGFYDTGIGRIEFSHTDASEEEIRANTINRDEYFEIPFATEEYTEHDLRMLDRSVDLLEEQKIKTQGGIIGTVRYIPCVD